MQKVQRLFVSALLIASGLTLSREVFPQCGSGFISVQGRVVDANGNPVRRVDLDFFLPNGLKLPTSGKADNTDSLGFYSVCIYPPAIYHITFAPLYPPNTNLVGAELFNVDLTSSRVLPDIVLPFGWAVAGRATDTLGDPVDSVNLAVDNLMTKQRLFTPGDKTDSLGNYRIVIPNGTYRFRYAPAPGRRELGVQLDTVKIDNRDTVIDIAIRPGFFINGTINDTSLGLPGTPIANVSVDMEDTLGNKIFLARNKSDSLGKFTVVAPLGIFHLFLVPPRDSHFVAKRIRRLELSGDTALIEGLGRGVLLTVRVRDSLNHPVPFADLDVFQTVPVINELFTPTDNADELGVIKVAVPPDSYRIAVNPPVGATNFDTLFFPELVQLFNDTTIDVILPGEPLVTPVAPAETRILDARPNPFRPAGGQKVSFPVDLDTSSGVWIISLTVFNSAGEIVCRDRKEVTGGARAFLEWDGRNARGESVASGTYFCRLALQQSGQSKKTAKTLKVALVR